MDIIRQKAIESLLKEALPKLVVALEPYLSKTKGQISAEVELLIKEAMALMHILQPVEEKAAGVEMDDDEAKMLLAAMDTPVAAQKKDLSVDMSDDEAKMLLTAMDTPAAEQKKNLSVDISDDEAKMLLDAMDAPQSTSTTASKAEKMSDDEASMLLAAMDKPADSPLLEPVQEQVAASEVEEHVDEVEEFGESEFSSDPDMIKDFINNSDELMATLDEQVLALEQSPNESGIIEEIFRAAHTLKGAAGMFAFKGIERVMHRMENYFDSVRKGKMRVDSLAIDVILKTMDVLRTLLDAVKETKPSGFKTVPIIEELNALCAGKLKSVSKAPPKIEKTEEPEEDQKPKVKKAEQATIRVDLKRLDTLVNLIGELVIDRTRFISIEEELLRKGPSPRLASNMSETVQLFGRHMNQVQDIIMNVRMVPVGNAFNKFPRVVRDLARSLGKEIDLVIEGEQTELDKTLVEQIGDPLVHLIRNAVDHGVEMPEDRLKKGKAAKGTILLSARQDGNQITIEIKDDGKGMDPEVLRRKGVEKGLIREDAVLTERDIFSLIFESGFSTAQKVTNISGRGVGMDVVRKEISKLKGVIDINSKLGKGSTFTIQLPLTLAIVQSLLVKAKGEIFAIPLASVVESLRIEPQDIQLVGGAEVIKRRDQVLPLLHLTEALALDSKDSEFWYQLERDQGTSKLRKLDKRLFVVVVGQADRRFGIVVDSLLNQQEMVIKPMGELMQDIPCVAGGAILGNGEVVLVLDLADLDSIFRTKSRQLVA